MSNSTSIYWEASGVSLHTEAWSVRTFGGSRNARVSKRGGNYSVPFRSGATYVRKFREERQVDLSMWLIPRNPDGTRDDDMSEEAKMHDNWNFLMSLFDVEGQFPLKKRWYENGQIKSATAMAELLDAPDPTNEGGHRLVFTVTLNLADPYFYGDTITAPVGAIDVQGQAATEHVTIVMPPGRVTLPDGNWVQWNGGGNVEVDCFNGIARQGPYVYNGLLDRNPLFPEWPRLRPGPQTIAGSGQIYYNPAYA